MRAPDEDVSRLDAHGGLLSSLRPNALIVRRLKGSTDGTHYLQRPSATTAIGAEGAGASVVGQCRPARNATSRRGGRNEAAPSSLTFSEALALRSVLIASALEFYEFSGRTGSLLTF